MTIESIMPHHTAVSRLFAAAANDIVPSATAVLPTTPTGSSQSAQGCAPSATLGNSPINPPNPEWVAPSLETQLCALADQNFKRDPGSRLKKLIEELGELAEAIVNRDNAAILEEAADCSFVLMDIAHLAGGSLNAAELAKWQIILTRKSNGVLHKEDRIRKSNP